ncbi:hypothetical protein FHS18_003095 [Paenibacillus phyllosphaerae]|uniref:Uncharacterized protein n=1 Tax=Paenibacillus phyllosphaerae TaxID=274593 RepID=A0A7W5FND7_9BACL|nr:hypothetical protein [Paenibacillus phyllosphaerae]MBB3111027.1 hypothetical protein [Paenibacillus phyllosphaerae]
MNIVSWRHHTARLILLGVILIAAWFMWANVIAPLRSELNMQTRSFEDQIETLTGATQDRRIIVYN